MCFLKERSYKKEIMDKEHLDPAELSQAFKDIRWVNRNLGGSKVLIEEIVRIIKKNNLQALTILDLATGSADIPIAVIEWGRANNVSIGIVALDMNRVAVNRASELCAAYPEIEVIQGDALKTNYSNSQFDIVISSMFMHHLNDSDAVKLLLEMNRLAKLAFIVNDLQRHMIAWWGISIIGFLTNKGRLFKNDAPLSVLKGFTKNELLQLIESSEISDVRIIKKFPFRLLVVKEKVAKEINED